MDENHRLGTDFAIKAYLLSDENKHHKYDIKELAEKIHNNTNFPVFIQEKELPTLCIIIENSLIVKLVFSDNEVIFVVAHGNSELELSPLTQSSLASMKAITPFLSKVFELYQKMFGEESIYKFADWIQFYRDFHTTNCKKCGQILAKDVFGVVVPPVLRDPRTGEAFHVCCKEGFDGIDKLGYAKRE